VLGFSSLSSFTMEDVIVEQCGNHVMYHGVWAFGTGVIGRCPMWKCAYVERVACVQLVVHTPLIGTKTTVHHNSTMESSDDYG